MVEYLEWVELGAYGLGALGAALVFVELFQTPSYVEYKPQSDQYRVDYSAGAVAEYTAIGRVGAFALALAFALLFVVRLVR